MTHVLSHALAWGLYKMRRDVGRMTFGYFTHSKKIGITCLVDVEGGSDLVPVTVFDAHEMSLVDFAKKITEKVMRAKNKTDSSHNKQTASAAFVPAFILQPIMHIISYLNIGLNLSIPGMARKDSFGHYILTNVGTLGMQQGFAPLCPPMRSIGLTCAGKIRKMPLVIDGELKIQSVLNTTSTGDHRYGDAAIFLPL